MAIGSPEPILRDILALHMGGLSLSKPEWGTKRVCQSCGAKFYDFARTPIICPKCSTAFDPEVLLKSRRSRAPAPAKPIKPAAPPEPAAEVVDEGLDLVAEDEDLAELAEDEEEDETVIEDASELGEDDEEMSKVVVPGGGDED